MKDWQKVLVAATASIREVIKVIDDGALQIALVVDADRRLLGTVTDGDVRRGILRGIALEEPVTQIMNAAPSVVPADRQREEVLALLRSKSLRQVPVVDQERRLVGLEVIDDLLQPARRDNLVVIMAGGLGSRLRPMTDDCPKPMLRVGGRPILETIVENFVESGFRRFCFAVNYRAEVIREYFRDGARFGCEIRYLQEEAPLGTAGALGLLPEVPTQPVLVMNGDVLTKVDFGHLLTFHASHQTAATMCVSEYALQVPYGVVRVDQDRLLAIEEKPLQKFFVNAGIYVLEPRAIGLIPRGQAFDMPSLFSLLVKAGHEAAVFPVREYWLDLGKVEDFRRAQDDYPEVFR